MTTLYKTFQSQGYSGKTITVKKAYHERYCLYKQTGPNFVIDYEMTLIPTEKDTVSVFFTPDEDTAITIEPICNGIEQYILSQNKQNINVCGFDILIENSILIMSDYRPSRTTFYTEKRFLNLLSRFGVKRYDSSVIGYGVPDATCEEFDYTNENLYTIRSRSHFVKDFDLNHVHPSKLTFPERFYVKTFASEEYTIKLIFYGQHWSERHVNRASVMSDRDDACINTMFMVNASVDYFIRDIYDQGYNLSNFMIRIVESDTEHTEDKFIAFQEELIWFLKGLLLANNNIDSI